MCDISNNILNQTQIDEFQARGVVVVPNGFSKHEVHTYRQAMCRSLKSYGVNASNMSSLTEYLAQIKWLSKGGSGGGMVNMFYENWQFRLRQHPALFATIR